MTKHLAINLIFIFSTLGAQNTFSQEDFETLYNMLNAKIELEFKQPPASSHDLNEYIKWMEIKAADRDNARAISLRANRDGNPYWENKFLNLSLNAQESGEVTIWAAVAHLMRGGMDDIYIDWAQCVFLAGPHLGQKLYNSAVANGFSTEDIVARARCLMRSATADLEAKWLYHNHEAFLGHYDANGLQVMPEGDWSSDCMRRDEFTTTNQGEPIAPAKRAMEMVQMVRDICLFYHLDGEFDDATDLMVQYLTEKQVLCLKPPNEGHQWYIDLAKQYELDKAKEHMEGFYATVKGKVEREKNGLKEPVAGADVEFEAPKDQRIRKTKTDPSGYYQIDSVMLHKNCGPFLLTARGKGCYKQEVVQGPLEEPDRSLKLEKNILMDFGIEGYSGSVTVTKSWDYTKDFGSVSIKHVGSQTVNFRVMFKPIPQMEGSEGQPITIFGPHKVTGTWTHNEDRYCSGDCDCPELNYQEFGSGDIPQQALQGLILMTNQWPTDNKVVADQLGQFGLVNWYDIATPTENVPIQTRSRDYLKDAGCQWHNSSGTANLIGASARYKLKDIKHLEGKVTWSSSRRTADVSITDMTEAIYDQKPFDPEQNGKEYTYSVKWDLKAL